MKRREFLGSAAAFVPAAATAQSARPARVGYLSGGLKTDESGALTLDILTESLVQLGWRLGATVEIQDRWAGGDFAKMPALAGELLAWQPDVLVTTGGTETRALQNLTKTIPIVFVQLGADPISLGFVKRIARPGGNVTGFMQGPQFLWGKRIELMTELLGRQPQHLAWMGNAANNGSEANWADATAAAGRFQAEIVRTNVAAAEEIAAAFDALKDRDALLVQYDFMLSTERRRIASLAAQQKIPTIYENRTHPLAGGLISYGGDLRENYRQGASYVHRILKGAAAAELPVVQASRFELVINLKTAKALGLTVSEAFLARADEVLE